MKALALVHAISVIATRLEEDSMHSIDGLDKKGYAGDWLVEYPDGKKAILSNDQIKKEFFPTSPEFAQALHEATGDIEDPKANHPAWTADFKKSEAPVVEMLQEKRQDLKHTVTQDDLTNNPDAGLKVGDKITIPANSIVDPGDDVTKGGGLRQSVVDALTAGTDPEKPAE